MTTVPALPIPIAIDAHDRRRARHAPGLLRAFNDAGVLSAADVHVAVRLSELAGEHDDLVALGAAFAVRGPRLGHVLVDLATIRATATVDADEPVDLSALPWPEPKQWVQRLATSSLVAAGEDAARAKGGGGTKDGAGGKGAAGAEDVADAEKAAGGEAVANHSARPLRLVGTTLYLDRYWHEECQVAADLRTFSDAAPATADPDVLADGLARLFPRESDAGQRLAAATAVERRFAVVAGGPGTGKTTTVARIVALLAEQAAAAGEPPPHVALAAPTGKAAARLEEAVHDEAAGLDVDDAVRDALLGLRASTLHRLLGWRPGSHSRFRHHRANRLPHDVVIVDETSMVSLTLMARLVEAVRPDARLVLVGDPGQLTSIEAGAVLGDIVGPATGEGIVVLDRVHRFGGGIALLADAIRSGDADAVIAVLESRPADVTWIALDVTEEDEGQPAHDAVRGAAQLPLDAPSDEAQLALDVARDEAQLALDVARDEAPLALDVARDEAQLALDVARDEAQLALVVARDEAQLALDLVRDEAHTALEAVREEAVAAGRAVVEAARAGAARDAIAALSAFRVLCAHRRGAQGVAAWTARIEGWLASAIDGFDPDGPAYVGRPLLVTENDYELRLYNGDTGVVVKADNDRVSAVFERGEELLEFTPTRLGSIETVFAMTIHKSQGSQFDTAVVLLPALTSRILTRELLYTAATRARARLVIVGTEETIRHAVQRPVARASGLRARLWDDDPNHR